MNSAILMMRNFKNKERFFVEVPSWKTNNSNVSPTYSAVCSVSVHRRNKAGHDVSYSGSYEVVGRTYIAKDRLTEK